MQSNHKLVSRRVSRSKCRIDGTVKYFNQSAPGRVIDLSEDGIALQLREPMKIRVGLIVSIQSNELGHLDGVVKWYDTSGKIGIKLQHTTSTLAQVSSYFRFFHQPVRPLLPA